MHGEMVDTVGLRSAEISHAGSNPAVCTKMKFENTLFFKPAQRSTQLVLQSNSNGLYVQAHGQPLWFWFLILQCKVLLLVVPSIVVCFCFVFKTTNVFFLVLVWTASVFTTLLTQSFTLYQLDVRRYFYNPVDLLGPYYENSYKLAFFTISLNTAVFAANIVVETFTSFYDLVDVLSIAVGDVFMLYIMRYLFVSFYKGKESCGDEFCVLASLLVFVVMPVSIYGHVTEYSQIRELMGVNCYVAVFAYWEAGRTVGRELSKQLGTKAAMVGIGTGLYYRNHVHPQQAQNFAFGEGLLNNPGLKAEEKQLVHELVRGHGTTLV